MMCPTDSGELSVKIRGILKMPMLCAKNLVIVLEVNTYDKLEMYIAFFINAVMSLFVANHIAYFQY